MVFARRRKSVVAKAAKGNSGALQEQFVSQPISPAKGPFITKMPAGGLASLPQAFTWRNRRHLGIECIDHARKSSPEGAKAGNEGYLRRQEFIVKLEIGRIARFDVQRHALAGQAVKQRWFLYTITSEE